MANVLRDLQDYLRLSSNVSYSSFISSSFNCTLSEITSGLDRKTINGIRSNFTNLKCFASLNESNVSLPLTLYDDVLEYKSHYLSGVNNISLLKSYGLSTNPNYLEIATLGFVSQPSLNFSNSTEASKYGFRRFGEEFFESVMRGEDDPLNTCMYICYWCGYRTFKLGCAPYISSIQVKSNPNTINCENKIVLSCSNSRCRASISFKLINELSVKPFVLSYLHELNIGYAPADISYTDEFGVRDTSKSVTSLTSSMFLIGMTGAVNMFKMFCRLKAVTIDNRNHE